MASYSTFDTYSEHATFERKIYRGCADVIEKSELRNLPKLVTVLVRMGKNARTTHFGRVIFAGCSDNVIVERMKIEIVDRVFMSYKSR